MECFICNNTNTFRPLSPDICKEENFLCQSCGLVFIPRAQSMQDYYKDDGYYEESPNKGLRENVVSPKLLEQLGKERMQQIFDAVDIDFKNKRVLDVGCGYGHLLYAIQQEHNATVMGIEPSPKVAELGTKMFGVEIQPILLEEFEPEEGFDIVLCNHTLEHVDDPVGFLNSLKNVLSDDGVLYVEVPNVMKPTGGFTLDAFLYNEHLQTFSEDNLSKLFNSSGLGVLDYDATTFLKFLVKPDSKDKKETQDISPPEVYNFLVEYKNNYGIGNHVEVYYGKFKYLLKAIRYKLAR